MKNLLTDELMKNWFEPISRRGSYMVFFGFILMFPVAVVSIGLGAEKPVLLMGASMWGGALGWQILTVCWDPRHLVSWFLLFAYVAVGVISLADYMNMSFV